MRFSRKDARNPLFTVGGLLRSIGRVCCSVEKSMPSPYNPHYDPLVSASPGVGSAHAPTYWTATAGSPAPDDGSVETDLDAEVVIIGAGLTGIATALYLAREHGIQARVLEANQTVWGCSSRNGGQGQNAAGRLTRSQWIARWGLGVAKQLDREVRTGYDNFTDLTRQIDCDAHAGGHLYLAHRPEKLAYLRNEARVRREVFGYDNLFGLVRSPALAPFRRLGQRILYRWYYYRDEK
jgi:hypothetical protein